MRDWDAYVRSRLSLPGLAQAREARIVREIAAQLEDFYRDAVARGLSDADADRFARGQVDDWSDMARVLSRVDQPNARPRLERAAVAVEEIAHDRSTVLRMLADLLHDMRFAVRQFAKSPGFTAVAILTLALGIGANSAMFSVVNGVLLRPLPFPEPDALVRVYEVVPQIGRFPVAPANFLDWRQQNKSFERMAAFTVGSDTLAEQDTPERVTAAFVSWDLFDLLQVSPVLGRTFVREEDAPMKANVVILSHGMWQRRYAGDPRILERTIVLGDTRCEIVGVMPQGFAFPSPEVEYWQPVGLDQSKPPRGAHYLSVVARLRSAASIGQATAEMKTIAEVLARQHPDYSKDESAEVVAMHEQVVGRIRPALLTLLAAVGVVVLIACANVANLLLARASARSREIAIRTALGAGRRRLMVQMVAESLVLALAGGTAGLLLAYSAIGPLRALNAGSIPRIGEVAIDGSVLAFTLLLCVITGIVFGLVPAWQASRTNVVEAMKEGGRGSAGSGGRWLRNTLVVAQVALSLVLLVGAALLLRSFSRLLDVDPGFRADNVLAFRVALPLTSYKNGAQRIIFFDEFLEKLRQLPRVRSAGMVQSLPIRDDYRLSFGVQGRPTAPGSGLSENYRLVSPGYFESLGIPIRRGRAFTSQDTSKSPLVAVVDESFARRHFPGEDPIGRGLSLGNGTEGFFEIVGVVGDVRYGGLDAGQDPTIYVPYAQDVFSTMWIVARTEGEPSAIASDVRSLLKNLDRNIPAFAMSPLTTVVSDSLGQRRFSMLLLGLFATIALLLAAVGLYGVIGYSVSQRTQEIGVRLAVGASRGRVLGMIIGQGLRLVGAGTVIGLAGALILARLVSTLLFEVTPFDPPSYAGTVLTLISVAILACWFPARRALRVDPIAALRCD
jgi:putative ABC transport system permease protein